MNLYLEKPNLEDDLVQVTTSDPRKIDLTADCDIWIGLCAISRHAYPTSTCKGQGVNFPSGLKIVQTDFYVYDLLSGADTIEEATCHIREVNNLLSSAGFSLRKWRSNVPEVLSGFSEQVEDRHNLRDFESDSCVKILGICRNPSLDIFQILVNDIPEQRNSKRHLLSHISRIFDPIGWLSPVIIRLKILLQSLWKQKFNWDDPLPDTLCSQWGALLSVELHGFCDSSEVAYAAVFYIISHFKSGQVKVSLIASKTRVAPLKMISIPRLELCAALLLATLYDNIGNSLCLQIDRVFLWTDSKIVLSWIKSESRHWKPFVGNRIAEVQRLTLHSSWHYVISKDNPADCASRGITPSELVDHSLWWRGPTWLSDVNFEVLIKTQYDFSKEISGNNLVKKIIHQCLMCFRAKRQVTKQIMGDLPMNRMVKSNPFTKTGIDFAGPFFFFDETKHQKIQNSDDFNPLTPGYFLIGRPLTAPPESNDDDDVPINYLDRWSLNKKIKNVFWKRWNREYLNNLQQRLKWQYSSPNIKEGDLILLKDTISPPAMYWSLGRITKVFPGADGKVRVVEVKTKHQERLTRTVSKIVPLPLLRTKLVHRGGNHAFHLKIYFFFAIGPNSQIPDIEKLQYLKGQLRGEALRLVKAFPITADNYVEFWQTLLTRYDNPKDLIFTQIDNALRLPKLADGNHNSMFKLLDSCNEIVRTVKIFDSTRPEVYDQYRSFIKEYLELGHMSLVPKEDIIEGRYYLPHHSVIKEKSCTTKLRVVFDASVKTDSGLSLNDALIPGPKIQQDLFHIILRFRIHPVAINADIAKMYRQIRRSQEDSEFKRIVWRNDPQDKIKDYRLETGHLWGLFVHHFWPLRIIKQLALDEQSKFPKASKIALTDFYVDDLVTGTFSVDEGKNLVQELYEELRRKLTLINQDLPSLEHIQIPRCVVPGNFMKVEFHGFCDASQKAYAASLYLKMDKLNNACETKRRTLESVIAEEDGELRKQEPSLEMLMSLRPKLLRCKDRFLIASDCLIEQLIKADREDEEIEDVDIGERRKVKSSSTSEVGTTEIWRRSTGVVQFWSAFQSVHDDDSISACVKFQYLQNCMIKGSVSEEIVSSFPNSAANYPLAISTLKERFGREDMLVEVYVRDSIAIILENVYGRNTTSFSTLYVRLSSQLRALGSLGVTTDKCAAILYPMHKSSEVLLEKLMEFLKHEVEGSERMRLARQPFSSSYPSQFNRDKPPKPKISVASAAILKGSQNSDGIEEKSKNTDASVDMSNRVRCQDVLLQTIMVKINGENKSKVVRVMLDSGSQNSSTALAWIKRDMNWSVFVAGRVKKIRQKFKHN
ncbi:hypothetical protein LAZ67_3004614 [Cordylochernes scorpioides]|uniref:DUF5641 domain-containing protein n=1 Tax=Cordylochernes scorpioides TaxID=51811 RepID=A0ABY6K9J3_9ARAC|nr:hypothetical protein LAZ67_3004614 [Cordylochernes scorpioides]